MADVENITITNSFDVKDYRALNSIKKRAIRRATLEQSVKATIKGLMTDIYSKFFSASSPIASGSQYEVLDGQQLTSTVVLTVRVDDDTDKEIQYQLQNPIFGGFNIDGATEDFLGSEVDIMCTEIICLTDSAALN